MWRIPVKNKTLQLKQQSSKLQRHLKIKHRGRTETQREYFERKRDQLKTQQLTKASKAHLEMDLKVGRYLYYSSSNILHSGTQTIRKESK